MHAVTFQAPGEVRVDERPDPELQAPDDAIVRIEATGVCGSDLHIFHGRVAIEPGFTIGHEYVGTVVAAGDARELASRSATASSAASRSPARICRACRAGNFHKCERSRTFGHGAALGGAAGHPGRAGARAPRQPHPAPRARGDGQRRRALRRRRDGHRLPRGRSRCARATASPCSASGRSGCAPSRPRAPPAPRRSSRSTPSQARLDVAARLRRGARAPHRGGPARGGQGRHRRARRRRGHRRGRRPARAGPGHPRGRQLRHGERRRRLRRALRGAHGPRLDQGADAAHRARPTSSATSIACSR